MIKDVFVCNICNMDFEKEIDFNEHFLNIHISKEPDFNNFDIDKKVSYLFEKYKNENIFINYNSIEDQFILLINDTTIICKNDDYHLYNELDKNINLIKEVYSKSKKIKKNIKIHCEAFTYSDDSKYNCFSFLVDEVEYLYFPNNTILTLDDFINSFISVNEDVLKGELIFHQNEKFINGINVTDFIKNKKIQIKIIKEK